jgi:hypothetical protein
MKVVDDVGLWLERILHVPNNLRGDSPKVAGCMDLLRVQGRWGPAARLAWVRCVLNSPTDVSGGEQLSKNAPNTFPPPAFWDKWARFFELSWRTSTNNIIKSQKPDKHAVAGKRRYFYTINNAAVEQLNQTYVDTLESMEGEEREKLGITGFSRSQLHAFVHYTVRGFLRADLYNALTEFLSRAHGSFGIQTHCSLEPGVVVIASKGQPMSISFDNDQPMCLYGSEAEALSVPIFESGKWLDRRLDLDNHG